MINGKIMVAIPGQGRLKKEFLAACSAADLVFDQPDDRNDRAVLRDRKNELPDIDIVVAKPGTAMFYMQNGIVDCAVMGQDSVTEARCAAREQDTALPGEVMDAMNIGRCKMVIAAPEDDSVYTAINLEGKRIATVYPSLLRAWLKANGVENATVVDQLDGGTETAVTFGLADAICEIEQSGKSLISNGLERKLELFNVSAVFVRTNNDIGADNQEILSRLVKRLKSAVEIVQDNAPAAINVVTPRASVPMRA